MSQRDTLVHLFAGGCGGTVGAILTCPLEVVKTRLQSSSINLYVLRPHEVQLSTVNGASVARVAPPGPLHCLKLILEREGPRSLFRGLGPNLVGVAPSRAIYFAAYSTAKEKLNGVLEPDSTQVHMVSAGMAVWSGPPSLLCVYRGESTAPKGQPGPLALGRTRQGFTVKLSPLRDWVGDPRHLSPPYLQATSCSGEELEELCPSLVSTRHRRYFLLLPSSSSSSSSSSLYSSLQQTCATFSSSRLNIGPCCTDTLVLTEVSS
ncbi:calcium-binding mitochondrial carrier protein SCaMC-3-like isoform X2 [Sphaeramia orbicularis]|uniref:calcium-binding mitochondrial carrier protein SCaMC-3-like isoform X2 n=1 Tax=Sphaeramia orbicularis TaxID=375764 RepID=UPI00117C88C5|nr:calcium-binding mitochondrial carrier protein SCaMC-3-like isoform X2 [Sphaeramia orbicularis]